MRWGIGGWHGRLLAGIAIAGSALAAASTAGAAPAPPLGHEGRWITDARGRVVILHGFNMVDKRPPYQPAARGFGRDDARFLVEHGFNTIRLGVIHKGLEPTAGRIEEGYLDQTAATVDVLSEAGIFVLLDFHQDLYNERFGGEGLPDWAVRDDGLPAEPDVGFPGNYLAMPALERAFDHFWANDPGLDGRPLQDAFAAAWRRVAERFRGEPRVLGYNLFNEPWPGSQFPSCLTPEGCPAFDLLVLTPFSRRVIAEIRKADRDALVWYAPNLTFDFGARTYHGDVGDDRAGFAFNNYCLGGDPLPSGQLEEQACGTSEERVFNLADEQARATGDALLMTEFGATDDIRTIERVAEGADDAMVSWQEWAYWNRDPSREAADDVLVRDPSKPLEGANVKREKLEVLARPYPQAVAGTPRSFSFDRGGGEFALRYSTTLPRGGRAPRSLETEVVVPKVHYPSGYAVEAQGAAVVSAPGAAVLRLRACEDAHQVRAVLRRTGATRSACPAPRHGDRSPVGRRGGSAPAGGERRARRGDGAREPSTVGNSAFGLAFTGFGLLAPIIAGVALLAAGTLLRRRLGSV